MTRRLLWPLATALILSLALLAGGCGLGKPPETDPPPTTVEPTPTPTPEPGENPQGNEPGDTPTQPGNQPEPEVPSLPGDMPALREALKAETPVTYTIVVANAPREVDKTAYLDQILEERGYPGRNEVLLVIFPEDNYNIRFAMGALLFDQKISLQQMLDMVQNQYLTRARQGDPAGGLAALVDAINAKAK